MKEYPTEVAEILDIPKEQYDKTKDDDNALKYIKKITSNEILTAVDKTKNKDSLIQKMKQKMKSTKKG